MLENFANLSNFSCGGLFQPAVIEQAKEAMFHRTQYLEVTKLSLRCFFLMVVKMINEKDEVSITFWRGGNRGATLREMGGVSCFTYCCGCMGS